MTAAEQLDFLFLEANADIDSVPFPEWTLDELECGGSDA